MRFYVLKNPKNAQSDAVTDFLSPEDSQRSDAPKCPACGRYTSSMTLLPPMRFELKVWGRRFGDIAFGVTNRLLLSERFTNAYLKSGLTGFSEFAPAELVEIVTRRKIKEPVPKYFTALPLQSRAAVDTRASGIDCDVPWTCEECRLGRIVRVRRLVIEPGTWSGEDIFIARGLPGRIVTSERFKKFCDSNAFSNCLLVDAEHFHLDFFPGKIAPFPDGS
jgi:hypothetical protein